MDAALLVDPARTAAVLVSLPEEMPVNETIELDAQLRSGVGIAARGAVPQRACRSALHRARRRALAARRRAAAARARPRAPRSLPGAPRASGAALPRARARRLDLPSTVLPLLPVAAWGPRGGGGDRRGHRGARRAAWRPP